jgi:4-amino-4-deoxychorismate lyase
VGRNKRLAGIKHLNRLEQVLARQEWDDPNIPEGLMLDEYQHVIEGTQSNLFLLQGETLLTPKLTHAGVAGVVRDLVLDNARELGLEALEADIPVNQITEADALFVTNSLLGLCPVAHLEGRYFDIGCIPSTLREMVQARCLGPNSDA